MANLDTTSKRRSSVGLMLVAIVAPPLPDGAIGQGDRQHIAVSYSGIAAAAPAVEEAPRRPRIGRTGGRPGPAADRPGRRHRAAEIRRERG